MDKIKTVTRDTCRLLRPPLEAALADLAAQLGMAVKVGSASYTASNVTFKVELAVIAEGGIVINKEASDFKELARLYGLEAADLGREFSRGGKTYKIVGCAPKSHRYPILCETGGKVFKLPADAVRAGLGKPPGSHAGL